MLFTSLRKPQEQIIFYEFKLLKEEKRGTVPRFILYVGLLFLGPIGAFFVDLLWGWKVKFSDICQKNTCARNTRMI